ncbi:calcium-binding tyrosine phosphorylation-regulated protein [Porphyrio hochstetteri]
MSSWLGVAALGALPTIFITGCLLGPGVSKAELSVGAVLRQLHLSCFSEHPNLDVTDLVEKFEFLSETGSEGREENTTECTGTLFSGEPKQRDKCTDTEEDQLLEEPDIQYSSKSTQCSSAASSIAESTFPPGPDGASAPEGRELVYVPAEPAQLAAHVLAMASSEAGQPPPPSNVWTLYCLNDLTQGQQLPSSLPPAGAAVPSSQGEDQHCGQLSQLPAPVYVMERDSEGKSAPPFILVGSNVQNTQGWKPLPGHAVQAPQGPGARKRLTAVPVPVARPAEEERDMASPNSHSAEETGAEPCPLHVFSVAIPLDDVMAALPGPPAAVEHTGRTGLAERHSAAGQHRVRKD